jgi:DNA invertase Pin-like site-specific DNA recombinase
VLLIAKLDRMSRSAGYIISLLEKSPIKFVCCDYPQADITMLSMLAVFAALERRMIGQRTKDALAQIKREIEAKGSRTSRRGRIFTKLGNPRLQEARAAASAANLTPPPPNTIAFIKEMREKNLPLRKIVDQLNSLNIKTGRGSDWYPSTIRALLIQQEGAA